MKHIASITAVILASCGVPAYAFSVAAHGVSAAHASVAAHPSAAAHPSIAAHAIETAHAAAPAPKLSTAAPIVMPHAAPAQAASDAKK